MLLLTDMPAALASPPVTAAASTSSAAAVAVARNAVAVIPAGPVVPAADAAVGDAT